MREKQFPIGIKQTEAGNNDERRKNFLEKLIISNFRGFPYQKNEADCFTIKFNTPDGRRKGSGLTIILGNNNCGKTTLLQAVRATRFERYDLNINAVMKPIFLKKNDSEIRIDLRTVAASDILTEQRTLCADIGNFKEESSFVRGMRITRNLLHSTDTEINQSIEDFSKRIFDTVLVAHDFLHKNFDTTIQQGISGLHDWEYIERKGTKAISMFNLGDGTLQAGFVVGNLISKNNPEPILLSDEPDTHVGAPHLSKLVEELLEVSVKKQVIITTHSPILVEEIVRSVRFDRSKNNQQNKADHGFLRERFRILTRKDGFIRAGIMEESLLPYPSANEISYLAFDRTTKGYYEELYEHFIESIKPEIEQRQKTKQSKEAEIRESVIEEKAKITNTEIGERKKPYNETPFTYLRNVIVHPENKERSYEEKELREYTEKLREMIKKLKEESKNGKKVL